MSRVVVAMSGGVDSSVAAALLLRAGHEVIGLFMRHGEPEPACDRPASVALPILSSRKQGCCSVGDSLDARRVADRLGIPFFALNFQEEFGQIMDYFVAEYTAGRTPNPCVVCNTWLKFGKLREYADSVGADFIATGHYARLLPSTEESPAEPGMFRGLDDDKDQTYALFGIDRAVLRRLMFPVGGYRKAEIRELARQFDLRVADKPDSQEICFVPDNDHAAFVRRRLGRSAEEPHGGEIVTTSGRVLGTHPGIEGFTVGQRKGLGVAVGRPQFVVRVEPDTRRVVVGDREELARRRVIAARANWLIDRPEGPFSCQVQIRYNSHPLPATVQATADGRIDATLDQPAYGVAPGQALVCYRDDRLLGGGWIEGEE